MYTFTVKYKSIGVEVQYKINVDDYDNFDLACKLLAQLMSLADKYTDVEVEAELV